MDEQLALFTPDNVPGLHLHIPARAGVVGDQLPQDPFEGARTIARTDAGTRTLAELLEKYAVVEANSEHGYMIMTEVPKTLADGRVRDPGMEILAATSEMGYSSPSPFTAWTRVDENNKLRDQLGIRVYYNMRRQDGAVRGSMRLVKTPVQSAHWYVEPSAQTTQEINKAKFVQDNLFSRLNVSWAALLSDILLMLDYGYMAFEKVFRLDIDGKLRLQKLAPRHPLDIERWEYDPQGGPNGCVMYSNPFEGPMVPTYIPIEKLVVFSHEPEAGDISGISILRSAYKHWYYKDTLYKIDAIQKERHGIGIPIIMLPPGFTPTDKSIADNLGRNLRTNERAHVVLPPNWTLEFAKLQGQPVDCLRSIEHHDMRIKSNVLGAFLDEPGTTKDATDIFLKSTRYIAEFVADIFNTHVIPQLCDFNFARGEYPKLCARRIGEWEDLRTLSFVLRNLVGADILRPDDPMEAQLRKEMDLPPMDPTTMRVPLQVRMPIANPPQPNTTDNNASIPPIYQQPGTSQNGLPQQNGPGQVGGPRQQAQPPVGTPRSNAGTDRSGK